MAPSGICPHGRYTVGEAGAIGFLDRQGAGITTAPLAASSLNVCPHRCLHPQRRALVPAGTQFQCIVSVDGAGVIGWLIIGLIAGALASLVMRGGGYGIIVGIIGAFTGGFILSLVGVGANGFWGTLVTAFIGACILIAILPAISGNRAGVSGVAHAVAEQPSEHEVQAAAPLLL